MAKKKVTIQTPKGQINQYIISIVLKKRKASEILIRLFMDDFKADNADIAVEIAEGKALKDNPGFQIIPLMQVFRVRETECTFACMDEGGG